MARSRTLYPLKWPDEPRVSVVYFDQTRWSMSTKFSYVIKQINNANLGLAVLALGIVIGNRFTLNFYTLINPKFCAGQDSVREFLMTM